MFSMAGEPRSIATGIAGISTAHKMPPGLFVPLSYVGGFDAMLTPAADFDWPISAIHAIPTPPKEARRLPRRKVGRQQKPSFLSKGSKNHNTGQCRPCRAVATIEGCPLMAACNYCHHSHSETKIMEAALFSMQKELQRTGKSIGAEAFNDKMVDPEHSESTCDNSSVTVLSSRSSSPSSTAEICSLPRVPHEHIGEPKYVILPLKLTR